MGFRVRLVAGELVICSTVRDEGVIGRGPEALHELLPGLDIAAWHDLHIWREWPAADAIAMGQPFALRAVAPVLEDLARVDLETVWPGGRRRVAYVAGAWRSSRCAGARPAPALRLGEMVTMVQLWIVVHGDGDARLHDLHDHLGRRPRAATGARARRG